MNVRDTIEFLSNDPRPYEVQSLLETVWENSTPQDEEDGYTRQARIISAILDRDVDRYEVVNAMDACAAIDKLSAGGDVNLMYGVANTEANRMNWLDSESEKLAIAARVIGGNR